MRILLVVESAAAGAGRHVLDLAAALLRRGDEISVVYSRSRADRAFLARVKSLDAIPQFRSQVISMSREVGFSDLRSYWNLVSYVRRNGPFDVIHGHSTKAGFLTRLLFCRSGARVVYTPHGLMTLDPSLRGLRRRAVELLESALSFLCDAVIVVSENERHCALATGIPAAKLITIPNGVDPQRANKEELRRQYGLRKGTIYIGWVGRLTKYKAPGRILDAFAAIRKPAALAVHLVVVGEGPLKASLQRQADRLGIAADVTFAGEVDGPSHIACVDVLAHTATFEAFPYVFLEALSAGIPVITTRVGAASELIEDEITGYVCHPWDASVFAGHLQKLVENFELRNRLSVAALERASQYTAAKMADRISALYQRISPKLVLLPLTSQNVNSHRMSEARATTSKR